MAAVPPFRSCGGRNRTYGLLIQSQASLPTATTPQSFSARSALRESNPPRQIGSLEPLPLGQGHLDGPSPGQSEQRSTYLFDFRAENEPPIHSLPQRSRVALVALPRSVHAKVNSGRRGSRTRQGAYALNRFRGGRRRQSACPSVRCSHKKSPMSRATPGCCSVWERALRHQRMCCICPARSEASAASRRCWR